MITEAKVASRSDEQQRDKDLCTAASYLMKNYLYYGQRSVQSTYIGTNANS